eukprot:augustus_masked-scaffold_29-processed-gene-2.9-mRNA-1 protein AED:1.00 eAED:1.00 QI:0/0/0/0/1/1/2/0/449
MKMIHKVQSAFNKALVTLSRRRGSDPLPQEQKKISLEFPTGNETLDMLENTATGEELPDPNDPRGYFLQDVANLHELVKGDGSKETKVVCKAIAVGETRISKIIGFTENYFRSKEARELRTIIDEKIDAQSREVKMLQKEIRIMDILKNKTNFLLHCVRSFSVTDSFAVLLLENLVVDVHKLTKLKPYSMFREGQDQERRDFMRLSVVVVYYILSAVLSGLQHIHLHGYIHRDIGPGNVMLSAAGIPKIIDFGLCIKKTEVRAESSPSEHRRVIGQSGYLPTEVLFDGYMYNETVDIYALGILCMFMLKGYYPIPSGYINADLNGFFFGLLSWYESKGLDPEEDSGFTLSFRLVREYSPRFKEIYEEVFKDLDEVLETQPEEDMDFQGRLKIKDILKWLTCLDCTKRPGAHNVLESDMIAPWVKSWIESSTSYDAVSADKWFSIAKQRV